MKRFNVEWVTHHKRAGGQGSVNAETEEQAIEEAKKVIVEHNPELTEMEITKLEIKVTEVA